MEPIKPSTPPDHRGTAPDSTGISPATPTTSEPQTQANPESAQVNNPIQATSTDTNKSIESSNSSDQSYDNSDQKKSKKLFNSSSDNSSGSIFSYIIVLVLAAGLALFIYGFVVRSYIVVGTSMTPTLQDGNRLIVNKVPVTWHKIFGGNFTPNRGDVIIFNTTMNIEENGMPVEQLIKRVIGLPGDRVVVKNNKITVYNKEHPSGFNPDDKSYGKNLAPTSGDVDITIPDGFVFVCGDNRVPGGSFDSRSELGPIPLQNIVGKLAIRYMPVNEISSF